MPAEQNYANHARYLPLYHFMVVPLFALHFIATVVYAFLHPREWMNWWQVVVAVALLLFVWAARLMALTGRNRAVLGGELREPDAIKRRVKTWRPDWLRA